MKKKILNNTWFWAGLIFALMMILYLLAIQIWRITSPTYKPVGLIDNVSRAPKNSDEWFIRREHGICPFDFQEYNIKKPFEGFKNC